MIDIDLHCLKGIATVTIDCIFPTADGWRLLILLEVDCV